MGWNTWVGGRSPLGVDGRLDSDQCGLGPSGCSALGLALPGAAA